MRIIISMNSDSRTTRRTERSGERCCVTLWWPPPTASVRTVWPQPPETASEDVLAVRSILEDVSGCQRVLEDIRETRVTIPWRGYPRWLTQSLLLYTLTGPWVQVSASTKVTYFPNETNLPIEKSREGNVVRYFSFKSAGVVVRPEHDQ